MAPRAATRRPPPPPRLGAAFASHLFPPSPPALAQAPAPPAALPFPALAESIRAAASPLLAAIGLNPATLPPALVPGLAAAAALATVALLIKRVFDTPSRPYDPANPNVGAEYDAWTKDGILEYYWGEHIHLGYYSPAERARGYLKTDFKAAKCVFVDEMLAWGLGAGGNQQPLRILDVGCGIGGASRRLAKAFPGAQVTGITLSPEQAARAGALARAAGLGNASFQVTDALAMTFPDDTFDLVWACESGEHMPDKAAYVAEMARVLAPGGTLVLATWCQRDTGVPGTAPLSPDETAALQFLYDEWAHPFFISIEAYGRLLAGTAKMARVDLGDWTPPTLPSWRHSNWVGVFDPWPVVRGGPRLWYSVLREIVTLERMHRAFKRGLMVYGMARAVKAGGAGGGGGGAGVVSEAGAVVVAP